MEDRFTDRDNLKELNEPLLAKAISIRYTNAYLKWAFLTCFLMGTSNFLTGELSGRIGTAGCYPFFIGNAICWILYHFVVGYQHKKMHGVWWMKETSTYYDPINQKFNWKTFRGPIIRGIVQVMIFFSIIYTFIFAAKAGANYGVIASLFSVQIVFSAFVFYFLYDESLYKRHIFGIMFFVASVALISLGKTSSKSTDSAAEAEKQQYLYMAVVTALISSLIQTINGVVMRHYVKYLKISALQLNNDGSWAQITTLAILFTMYVRENGMYEYSDFFEAIGASFISMLGNVCLSHTLSIGLGGPVQGIVNLMSIVNLLYSMILLNQIPATIQVVGTSLGIFGALIISGIDKIFTS